MHAKMRDVRLFARASTCMEWWPGAHVGPALQNNYPEDKFSHFTLKTELFRCPTHLNEELASSGMDGQTVSKWLVQTSDMPSIYIEPPA